MNQEEHDQKCGHYFDPYAPCPACHIDQLRSDLARAQERVKELEEALRVVVESTCSDASAPLRDYCERALSSPSTDKGQVGP